jgi:hypothetical protein
MGAEARGDYNLVGERGIIITFLVVAIANLSCTSV